MKIKSGNQTITVKDIYGENAHYDGKARPTLRVSTDTPLTDDEIAALLSNDWELIEEGVNGGEYIASTHKGYGAVHRHQTVFIQTETPEERETALRQRIAELEAATQELAATKVVMPINETFTTANTKKGE